MSNTEFNAEHRSANLSGDIQPINVSSRTVSARSGITSRLQTIRNITRRCDFCSMNGHTVYDCYDERLYEFEYECFNKKNHLAISSDSINVNKRLFKQWIMDRYIVYANLVKSFAIKKCGYRVRGHNIEECFDLIIRFFYGTSYESEEETRDNENLDINDDFIAFPEINVTISDVDNIMRYYNNIEYNNHDTIYEQIMRSLEIKVEPFNTDLDNDTCDCNICYETYDKKDFVKLNCNHMFCKNCIKNTIKTINNINELKCALCRKKYF